MNIGHMFHPGQVTRTVEQIGDDIGIRLIGTGNAQIWGMDTVNEGLAPANWEWNALTMR
jgi:hypothetical protein